MHSPFNAPAHTPIAVSPILVDTTVVAGAIELDTVMVGDPASIEDDSDIMEVRETPHGSELSPDLALSVLFSRRFYDFSHLFCFVDITYACKRVAVRLEGL